MEKKVIDYASPTARPHRSGAGAAVILALNVLGFLLGFVMFLVELTNRHDSLAQLPEAFMVVALVAAAVVGCLVPTLSYILVCQDRLDKGSKRILLVTGIAACLLAGCDLLVLRFLG